MTEDEMAGWHHWFKGDEFEQTLGDGAGQEAEHATEHSVLRSWAQLSNWTRITPKRQSPHLRYKGNWMLIFALQPFQYLMFYLQKGKFVVEKALLYHWVYFNGKRGEHMCQYLKTKKDISVFYDLISLFSEHTHIYFFLNVILVHNFSSTSWSPS